MFLSLSPSKLATGFTAACFVMSTNVQAGSESYAENDHWPKDSWHLEYEYEDFSDKITSAKLVYAPGNYGPEKAFLIRCQPYYTNFSVAFIAPEKDIKEDGEYHNNADKFAEHGFVYSQERDITFKVNADSYDEEVEVGGHNRGISKWIRAASDNLPADSLQMNLFSTLVFSDIPSFLGKQNNDLSENLYAALKSAINNESSVQFKLKMPNDKIHEFSLDGKRLKAFAPQEVLDFCLLKRRLRED